MNKIKHCNWVRWVEFLNKNTLIYKSLYTYAHELSIAIAVGSSFRWYFSLGCCVTWKKSIHFQQHHHRYQVQNVFENWQVVLVLIEKTMDIQKYLEHVSFKNIFLSEVGICLNFIFKIGFKYIYGGRIYP